MMTTRRIATAGAAVVAAVLGMAACSAHSPTASVRSPSSPAASATAGLAEGTELTGVQLNSALAPASSFPGFTANAKDAYNTGTSLEVLPTQYNVATMSCPSFSTQMTYATWLGQDAIAWAEFDRATGGQSSQTYDEFIYQFPGPSAAVSFIQGLRAAYSRCQSFTDTQSGESVQVTYGVANIAPIGGGQAMQVAGTAVANGATVGTAGLLYVVSSDDVYGVVRTGVQTSMPATPAAATVIAGMITRVQTLSAAS